MNGEADNYRMYVYMHLAFKELKLSQFPHYGNIVKRYKNASLLNCYSVPLSTSYFQRHHFSVRKYSVVSLTSIAPTLRGPIPLWGSNPPQLHVGALK